MYNWIKNEYRPNSQFVLGGIQSPVHQYWLILIKA